MKGATQVRAATIAVAVGALTTGLMSSPAHAAAAKGETFTRSYTLVKEFNSKPLKRCARLTVWGSVTFTRTQGQGFYLVYKNIKVNNPTARVSALAKCGRKKSSTLTKGTITQRWYESSCKANVKVAVGFPWAVSVEPTVECGNRRVGKRKTTYTGTAKTYTQYNSGRPLSFTGTLYAGPSVKQPPAPLCLSAKPTITIYAKSKSDSFTTTMKACVKP